MKTPDGQFNFDRTRDRGDLVDRRNRRRRRRGRRRARRLAGLGIGAAGVPARGAAPLRQHRARRARHVRQIDRARNRQALVGGEDRGRRGDQQGRDLDLGLCRPHRPAQTRRRARRDGRGPAQAARRARGARPLQFPGPSAQRPHRPCFARGQCGGVQAVGKDPRDRRVSGQPVPRGRHSRRRGALPDRRPRRGPRARRRSRYRRAAVHRLGARRDGAQPPVRRNAGQDPRARTGRQQSAGGVGRRRSRFRRGDRGPVRLHERGPALHRGAAADRRRRPAREADRQDRQARRPADLRRAA